MDFDKLTREELIQRLEQSEARRDEIADRDRFVHELQVHQVELEAQNEALRDAQGLLEESRSRYADLYDFAPIPYVTFDPSGLVLDINLTGASTFGIERSRIVGHSFLSLVHLEDPNAFVRHIRTALASSAPATGEIALSTERGRLEFQLVSGAAQRRHDAAAACRTAFLDITRRRFAEREARLAHESERKLRARLEGIDRASAVVSAGLAELSGPDVTPFLRIVIDETRRAVDAQYAVLGVGGGSGKTFQPWVFSGMTPEQAKSIGRVPLGTGFLGAVLHAGRTVRIGDLRKHPSFGGFPSGHPRMTRLLGVPIRYQGKPQATLFLARDETSEEFTEEDQSVAEMLADRVGVALEIARLRQVEAREHSRLEFLARAGPLLAESIDYETTLETVARLVVPIAGDMSAIDLVEEAGRVRKAVIHHPDAEKKKALEQLLGTTPPERLPESVRLAIETGEPQRRDAQPDFLRGATSEPAYRGVLDAVQATCTLVVPLIARDRVIGLLRLAMAESGRTYSDDDLPLVKDIAHHAALAIEAANLYRAAQTAIQARDNLLAAVSHDLRNYLVAAVTSVELLPRKIAAADQPSTQKLIGAISRSVKRIQQLIGSLRDATMIETGQFTIEPRPESLESLLDDASQTLGPQAEALALALEVRVEDEPPDVRCDRERVLQVLTNLVGNAMKFTQEGGRISIVARPAEGGAAISVSDTGSGIPEPDLKHIFDRHWTGRANGRHGTGLGLFIARGIVEAHGGTIGVESAVGRGTTFVFTLPRAHSGDDAMQEAHPEMLEPSRSDFPI